MNREIINIGTLPNDGTGDPLRTSFDKINTNFEYLFKLQVEPPEHNYGKSTDVRGMVAYDETYIYYCFNDYVDDSTVIWKRTLLQNDIW